MCWRVRLCGVVVCGALALGTFLVGTFCVGAICVARANTVSQHRVCQTRAPKETQGLPQRSQTHPEPLNYMIAQDQGIQANKAMMPVRAAEALACYGCVLILKALTRVSLARGV